VREDVPADRSWYVSALRQELIARNSSYAALNFLPHVTSYGELPAVVYQRSECGRDHGNFISASYRAILKRPQWQRRLQKVHCHCRRSLPAIDEVARARFFIEFRRAADEHFLLPRRDRRMEVCRILRLELGTAPRIWIYARRSVTQRNNRADRS
jgi:hypothetical protein